MRCQLKLTNWKFPTTHWHDNFTSNFVKTNMAAGEKFQNKQKVPSIEELLLNWKAFNFWFYINTNLWFGTKTFLSQDSFQHYCTIISWRLPMANQLYKGMFPCFFHGFSSFLVANTSKSLQIRLRVMWGLIISSTNPVNRQKLIG